jgi:hypothetical protein
MQMIDFNKKYNDSVIQDNWKQGLLPHFSGVVIGDGTMIAMGENSFRIGGVLQHHVYPICESSISSFMKFEHEFVEIEPRQNRVVAHEPDYYAICGEGGMGNEGFVAVIKGDSLIWSAFFTVSNPFYELRMQGNSIIATSTHDRFWKFPVSEPWNGIIQSDE